MNHAVNPEPSAQDKDLQAITGMLGRVSNAKEIDLSLSAWLRVWRLETISAIDIIQDAQTIIKQALGRS